MTWLKYSPRVPFALRSGKSHWFIDAREIFEDKPMVEAVYQYWASLCPKQTLCVVAVPDGGIPWATGFVDWLHAKKIIAHHCHADKKCHSEDSYRIIIEDVITTGASIEKVKRQMDDSGHPHDRVFCVVSRSNLAAIAFITIQLPLPEEYK